MCITYDNLSKNSGRDLPSPNSICVYYKAIVSTPETAELAVEDGKPPKPVLIIELVPVAAVLLPTTSEAIT